MTTTISDLLDVIHETIIANKGENNAILAQLQAIDMVMQEGDLENYIVDVPFFRSIVLQEAKEILK